MPQIIYICQLKIFCFGNFKNWQKSVGPSLCPRCLCCVINVVLIISYKTKIEKTRGEERRGEERRGSKSPRNPPYLPEFLQLEVTVGLSGGVLYLTQKDTRKKKWSWLFLQTEPNTISISFPLVLFEVFVLIKRPYPGYKTLRKDIDSESFRKGIMLLEQLPQGPLLFWILESWTGSKVACQRAPDPKAFMWLWSLRLIFTDFSPFKTPLFFVRKVVNFYVSPLSILILFPSTPGTAKVDIRAQARDPGSRAAI